MRLSFRRLPCFLFLFLPSCGSVTVETDSHPELTAACKDFIATLAAYDKTCSGHDRDYDEKAEVDGCVGVATAPGSLVGAADVKACTAELAAGCSVGGFYPSCVGGGQNILYPNHDRKGTAKAGDPCVANLQCESGYCTEGIPTCGNCLVPRALGEACSGPYDICTTSSAVCDAGTCRLSGKTEGEKCSIKGVECNQATFCNVPAQAIEGVCTARLGAGAACSGVSDFPCAEGLICESGVCAAPPPGLPDGAACQSDEYWLYPQCEHACIQDVCQAHAPPAGTHPGDDCSYTGACATGLQCYDGVCKVFDPGPPGPHASEGEVCMGEGALNCKPGLSCDRACGFACDGPFLCVVTPKIGEPCALVNQCEPEAICAHDDPSDLRGVCKKAGREGDPCPCEEDLACGAGVCVPFGAQMCE